MIEAKVLDHGYLKFIESWGSDERIIEAARMSTAKGFLGWGGPCPDLPHDAECRCKGTGQLPGDEKLLRFLWENKHQTPFEMAGLTVEVQAPIFVFREWHRHRVPFVPRGAGTSLAGGTLAIGGGVMICLTRGKRCVEVSTRDRSASVAAGGVNQPEVVHDDEFHLVPSDVQPGAGQ